MAQQGLAWIQKLYRIEEKARIEQFTAPEREAYWQKYAVPILDKLRKWLDASQPAVPPGTLAGKA